MPRRLVPPLTVEQVGSALHRRVWSFDREAGDAERVLVLLRDGSAEVERAGGVAAIVAPAVQWTGSGSFTALRLEPGSTGYVARVSEALILETMGSRAESANLAAIVNRDFVLSLAGEKALADEVLRCIAALRAETTTPLSGSQMMTVSLLRIIFLSIMRKVTDAPDVMAPARGEAPLILQRFRQAVELHFREHWPVRHYAEVLGVSHDRLHAICIRALGKSPKALIGDRLMREAALHLARTRLTTKQVSFALGFRDPAHFGNFFKQRTGHAPGAFRALMDQNAGGHGAELAGFADWP